VGAIEAGFEIVELRLGQAAGCKVVPEFLDDDLAGDGSWTGYALKSEKSCVLDRARSDEGCQVYEPAG